MLEKIWNVEGDEYVPLRGDIHICEWPDGKTDTYFVIGQPRCRPEHPYDKYMAECLVFDSFDVDPSIHANCRMDESRHDMKRSYGLTIIRDDEIIIFFPRKVDEDV